MSIILFDDSTRKTLLPLTFTRPVASLRIGILTIAEKWEYKLKAISSFLTEDYLREKFPYIISSKNLLINGSCCPGEALLEAVHKLQEGEVLKQGELILAAKVDSGDVLSFTEVLAGFKPVDFEGAFTRVVYPEDIFKNNDAEIRSDFKLLTHGRTSATLSGTNTVLGDNIFVEEGATAECSIFNTKDGPIYLGKNSAVWEGSQIRGSFALCHDSQVKMGAKIYSKTTIGPYCRVAGEINNAVIYGCSSKGHEGYLGNSVIGEWCNIGADSNNSNLKNNYSEVTLWDYTLKDFRKTGIQFCGLVMADHSKCGINTMFNTGTVVGVSANVFGAGFPKHFVPDFAWGGAGGFDTYRLDKAFQTAEKVFERRSKDFDDVEKRLLANVFELTQSYRNLRIVK